MDDRELLELAAKESGIKFTWADGPNESPVLDNGETWNPLTDDGDALRLAGKLGFSLDIDTDAKITGVINNANIGLYCYYEECNNDPYAATRRAIVRAAAEIGKGME